MLAPVHAMAAGGAPKQPAVPQKGTVRVIHPQTVLRDIQLTQQAQPTQPAAANHVADLMVAVGRLQSGAGVHPPPKSDEAQVLRLATYSGDQLVGGYTLVVTGGR
jgi:hypothetical protein